MNMTLTHRHELTFTGMVPDNEMERAPIFASDPVQQAVKALLQAFEDAGVPHTISHKVVAPSKRTGQRKRRSANGEASEEVVGDPLPDVENMRTIEPSVRYHESAPPRRGSRAATE